MDFIIAPFSMLLRYLTEWTDSYGLALILLGLIVTLIRVPFDLKSKRSMMKTSLIQPKIMAIREKFSGNQVKMNQELSKLYQEEDAKPMGGCIWMMIPMLVIMLLFWIVREPLTHLMGLDQEQIDLLRTTLEGLGHTISDSGLYQVQMTGYIRTYFTELHAVVPQIFDINMNFFGLNIGEMPSWNFFAQPGWTTQDMVLALLPALSAVSVFFQQRIMQATNYQQQMPQQAQMMRTMSFMMPMVSLVIGFSFPAAMSIYWITNGLALTLVSVFTNLHFKKVFAGMKAEMEERDKQKQAIIDEKRRKTEELKALGLTQENKGTSKKKKQLQEREKERQRKAAERASERDDEDEVTNPSRVAHRKYARGRAYDPNRFDDDQLDDLTEDDLDLNVQDDLALQSGLSDVNDSDLDDLDDEETYNEDDIDKA